MQVRNKKNVRVTCDSKYFSNAHKLLDVIFFFFFIRYLRLRRMPATHESVRFISSLLSLFPVIYWLENEFILILLCMWSISFNNITNTMLILFYIHIIIDYKHWLLLHYLFSNAFLFLYSFFTRLATCAFIYFIGKSGMFFFESGDSIIISPGYWYWIRILECADGGG